MVHDIWQRYRQVGARRLAAAALRRLADRVEAPWHRPGQSRGARAATPSLISPEYIRFQQMPHGVLARYVAVAGKQVLEIGGA